MYNVGQTNSNKKKTFSKRRIKGFKGRKNPLTRGFNSFFFTKNLLIDNLNKKILPKTVFYTTNKKSRYFQSLMNTSIKLPKLSLVLNTTMSRHFFFKKNSKLVTLRTVPITHSFNVLKLSNWEEKRFVKTDYFLNYGSIKFFQTCNKLALFTFVQILLPLVSSPNFDHHSVNSVQIDTNLSCKPTVNFSDRFYYRRLGVNVSRRPKLLYKSYTNSNCHVNLFTFVKVIGGSIKKNQLHPSRRKMFLVRKKNLYREIQKHFIKTGFLRFYNRQVYLSEIHTSKQVVTRHLITKNDNWFSYPTRALLHTRVNICSTFTTLNQHFNWVKTSELLGPYFYTLKVGSIRNKNWRKVSTNTFFKKLTWNNSFNAINSKPCLLFLHQVVPYTCNKKSLQTVVQKILVTKPINGSAVNTNFNYFSNSNFFKRSLNFVFLYKYFVTLFSWGGRSLVKPTCNKIHTGFVLFFQTYFFESRGFSLNKTNLISPHVLSYRVRKKFLNFFLKHPFNLNVTMWYHTMLVRFIENCSGMKVGLFFNPFLENSLTYVDIARCNSWSDRVFDFRRLLGPKIFIKESLKIFHLALKMKDPTFLSGWIREMLKRTSFWKYRVLFRYIKYIVRYLFSTIFDELQFKGFKLKLKGKISVGGNSRARTLMYRVGETSQSTFHNKITHDINFVYTFTGVMGFQLWFYF